MEEYKIEDYRLKFPFSMLVCGSSLSGKTTFTLDLIKNRKKTINTEVNNIIYVYGESQPIFEALKEEIKFVPSIESAEALLSSTEPNIIVFDDILSQLQGDKLVNEYITRFFVQRCHHQNTACVSSIFQQHTLSLIS